MVISDKLTIPHFCTGLKSSRFPYIFTEHEESVLHALYVCVQWQPLKVNTTYQAGMKWNDYLCENLCTS